VHQPCPRAVSRRPRRLGRRASGPAVCQLVRGVRRFCAGEMCQQHFSSILGCAAGANAPGQKDRPMSLLVPTRHGRSNPVALAAIPLIRARADEVGHRAEQWPKAARPSRSEGTMTEAVLGRSWHEPAACPQQWRESGTAPPRTWPTATPVRAHANASSDSAKLSLFCGGEGDGAEVHWNWLCGRVLCAEKESISAKAPSRRARTNPPNAHSKLQTASRACPRQGGCRD